MWNWVAKLEELRKSNVPVACVTVTANTGSTPRDVGAKMLVIAGGEFFGTVGGGRLEELALADARKCLEEESSKTIRYPLGAKTGQCCGGVVDLFFEVMNVGPQLYLFGAGHVGQAICKVLEGTPFHVHLIDERKEWVDSPSVPPGVSKHETEWDDFAKGAPWSEKKTYVAIMTHQHDLDQDILAYVMKKPARYIGLIGSESKWKRFKQRLSERGFTDAEFARVECPLGLDIGGKAPQEVAISLASKMLKIHYGR